jgi:hypothetical protein
LYTGAGAVGPGLLRLVDINGDFEAIPIMDIVAIYPGDGTVYDPSFTYLVPPDPLAPGCDTDRLCAILSYLPLNTTVELRLGPAVSASGDVYRSEYGVLILSDAGGNTPVIVSSMQILRMFITETALARSGESSASNPRVGLIQP